MVFNFSLDLGGKNGGVLSMRMQVILDSLFARPGSAPIGAGRKESSGTGLGTLRSYYMTTQLVLLKGICIIKYVFRNSSSF